MLLLNFIVGSLCGTVRKNGPVFSPSCSATFSIPQPMKHRFFFFFFAFLHFLSSSLILRQYVNKKQPCFLRLGTCYFYILAAERSQFSFQLPFNKFRPLRLPLNKSGGEIFPKSADTLTVRLRLPQNLAIYLSCPVTVPFFSWAAVLHNLMRLKAPEVWHVPSVALVIFITFTLLMQKEDLPCRQQVFFLSFSSFFHWCHSEHRGWNLGPMIS